MSQIDSSDDNTLDFSSAMAQFKSMFPDLSDQIIEAILRKHNGDVTRTIDELLEISGENNASQASSSSAYFQNLPNPPPYDAVASGSCSRQTVNPPVPSPRDKSVEQTRTSQPNCADDEKIALLIQNREFLGYLQRDPQFMRAIHGDSYYDASPRHHYSYDRSSNRWLPQASHPILLSSSRPYSSRHNYRFERYDDDYRSTSSRQSKAKKSEHAPPVPDGPVVDFSNGSIPNGPVIDFPNAPISWTTKIKNRLPSVHKSSNEHPKTGDTFENTVPIEYEHFDERHLADRLKNMSRNSKALFMTLARKFSSSNRDPYICPSEYEEKPEDFSYSSNKRSASTHR
ncbi:CUE domain-containing protein [Ditylenchus destructor]|nr:CUE domain-containing protein [Ditylenchus destructor]